MNTKTLKGILLYSLILIGSALAVFAAIVIIMFIFPNLKLFGYGMISKKQTSTNSTTINTSEIDSNYNIVVGANNFDIEITATTENTISYTLFNNCLGASNINTASANEEIGENSYSINITEPSGVVFYRKSSLKIKLPSSLTYNFVVKSGSGNITLSNLQINNLKIKTGSGNFYLSHAEQTILELNSVDITTNKGDFNFKSKYENVKITNGLTLNANKGDFLFNNLESDVKIVGKDIYFEANTLTTSENGFDANVSNIVLKVNHLNSPDAQNSILTSSSLININELTGISSIKSSNGNITLGTIHSSAIIYSSEGNVKVENAEEYIKIDCDYSDITLGTYAKSAYIKSSKGNIYAKSIGGDYENNETKIETSTGNITFTTEYIPFEIISDGNSSITVDINHFSYDKDQYIINAPNSSVKVFYSSTEYFKYEINADIYPENGNEYFSSEGIHPNNNFKVDPTAETDDIQNGIFKTEEELKNFKENLSLLKINTNKLII